MTLAIILAVAEIFGLFFIGAVARWIGYLNDNDVDRFSKVTLDILLPAFTFSTIIKGIDTSHLHDLWVIPAVGLLQVLIFIVAGFPAQFGIGGRFRDKRRTFMHLCAVNNATFLPTIILQNIGGESSLATLFLLYLGSTVGVWTIGVGLLGTTSIKEILLKGFVRPNFLAIILALIITLAGGAPYIPHVVIKVLSTTGSIAVPLIMILTGTSFAHRGMLKFNWPIMYVTFVRLILLPAVTIPVMLLLPLKPHVYQVSVIVALMPTAISSVIMTRRYGGDPDYAASAALITTVASIVTVPVAVWLLFGR
jgi:predicted permease